MTRPRRRAVPFVLIALAVAGIAPGVAAARMSIFYDEQAAVRVLTDPSGPGDPIDASRGATRQDPGAGGIFDPAGNDAAHRIAKLSAGEIEGLSPEAMADRIQEEIDDPEIPNTSGLVGIDEIGNRWNDGKVRITYSYVRVRGKRIKVASGNKIVVTRRGWKLVKGAAALPALDPAKPGAKLSAAMDLLAARPHPGGGTYAERVHLYIAPAFSTSIAAGRGPHRHLGNDGKPHRATWRGVMPAVGKAGGVWIEMYHHDGTLTSMTAKEWRTVPQGFASYAARFGAQASRLHLLIGGTPAPAGSSGCGDAMACQWALAGSTVTGRTLLANGPGAYRLGSQAAAWRAEYNRALPGR